MRKFSLIILTWLLLSCNVLALDCDKSFLTFNVDYKKLDEISSVINSQPNNDIIERMNNSSDPAVLYVKGVMITYGRYYPQNYNQAFEIFDSLSLNANPSGAYKAGMILLLCSNKLSIKNKNKNYYNYFKLSYDNGGKSAGYFKLVIDYFNRSITEKEYVKLLSDLINDKFKDPMLLFELSYLEYKNNNANYSDYLKKSVFFYSCDFYDILVAFLTPYPNELKDRIEFIKKENNDYYQQCS